MESKRRLTKKELLKDLLETYILGIKNDIISANLKLDRFLDEIDKRFPNENITYKSANKS